MQVRMMFLHALSPLHVGTGQGVGVIDLPVAREKGTGIPILPGSSLKGVLRAAAPDNMRVKVFGPETDQASAHAGSVQIGDLHLLFLPVRSLRGTFAWVTSPFLLQRFARDIGWIEPQYRLNVQAVPKVDHTAICLVPNRPESVLTMKVKVKENGQEKEKDRVILEDLDLHPAPNEDLAKWADVLAPQMFADETWRGLFAERMCMVHDDVMRFLLDTALEVTARIRLDEQTKTVQRGALWYEEALPAETIMAGLVVISPVKATDREIQTVLQQVTQKPLQLGGNATVGRGLCQLSLL